MVESKIRLLGINLWVIWYQSDLENLISLNLTNKEHLVPEKIYALVGLNSNVVGYKLIVTIPVVLVETVIISSKLRYMFDMAYCNLTHYFFF